MQFSFHCMRHNGHFPHVETYSLIIGVSLRCVFEIWQSMCKVNYVKCMGKTIGISTQEPVCQCATPLRIVRKRSGIYKAISPSSNSINMSAVYFNFCKLLYFIEFARNEMLVFHDGLIVVSRISRAPFQQFTSLASIYGMQFLILSWNQHEMHKFTARCMLFISYFFCECVCILLKLSNISYELSHLMQKASNLFDFVALLPRHPLVYSTRKFICRWLCSNVPFRQSLNGYCEHACVFSEWCLCISHALCGI